MLNGVLDKLAGSLTSSKDPQTVPLEAQLNSFFSNSPWKVTIEERNGIDWYAWKRFSNGEQLGDTIFLMPIKDAGEPFFQEKTEKNASGYFMIPVFDINPASGATFIDTRSHALVLGKNEDSACEFPSYVLIPQSAGENSGRNLLKIDVDKDDFTVLNLMEWPTTEWNDYLTENGSAGVQLAVNVKCANNYVAPPRDRFITPIAEIPKRPETHRHNKTEKNTETTGKNVDGSSKDRHPLLFAPKLSVGFQDVTGRDVILGKNVTQRGEVVAFKPLNAAWDWETFGIFGGLGVGAIFHRDQPTCWELEGSDGDCHGPHQTSASMFVDLSLGGEASFDIFGNGVITFGLGYDLSFYHAFEVNGGTYTQINPKVTKDGIIELDGATTWHDFNKLERWQNGILGTIALRFSNFEGGFSMVYPLGSQDDGDPISFGTRYTFDIGFKL